MNIAAEIVDAIFKAIAGGVALTEQDRATAKAAVNAKLDEIAAKDPGPLGPRADAVRARHLAARHGLDPATMTVLAADDTEHLLHVDVLRTLAVAGPLRSREAEAVRYAIGRLDGREVVVMHAPVVSGGTHATIGEALAREAAKPR